MRSCTSRVGGEVYSFNGRGNSATVFDARIEQRDSHDRLAGETRVCRGDPEAGRVYVNIEDKNEVVAIDTRDAPDRQQPGRPDRRRARRAGRHKIPGCTHSPLFSAATQTDGDDGGHERQTILATARSRQGVRCPKVPIRYDGLVSSCGEGSVTLAAARTRSDYLEWCRLSARPNAAACAP